MSSPNLTNILPLLEHMGKRINTSSPQPFKLLPPVTEDI
jgi:hypothetical protein